MGIGSFYNAKGVKVGQAMGMYAPLDTPLPADSIVTFDETVWSAWSIGVGAASAGTFTLTISDGPLLVPVVTAAIAYNAAASAVKAAVEAALGAGYTATVTGTSPSWKLSIAGPGASEFAIVGTGTGLTGGGYTQTAPAWSPFGGTEQGWTFGYAPNVQNINIEEQATQVDQELTDATFTFSANLAENKLSLLQTALGGNISVVAAGIGVYGKRSLTLASALPRMAVALETQNYRGTVRRYYVPEMAAQAQVSQAFRRASGMQMIPVTFTSTCAPELIVVEDILAVPTG